MVRKYIFRQYSRSILITVLFEFSDLNLLQNCNSIPTDMIPISEHLFLKTRRLQLVFVFFDHFPLYVTTSIRFSATSIQVPTVAGISTSFLCKFWFVHIRFHSGQSCTSQYFDSNAESYDFQFDFFIFWIKMFYNVYNFQIFKFSKVSLENEQNRK